VRSVGTPANIMLALCVVFHNPQKQGGKNTQFPAVCTLCHTLTQPGGWHAAGHARSNSISGGPESHLAGDVAVAAHALGDAGTAHQCGLLYSVGLRR
jgi:hypothetical protein